VKRKVEGEQFNIKIRPAKNMAYDTQKSKHGRNQRVPFIKINQDMDEIKKVK